MLTIDNLNALGVDTQDGLHRCMNMEAFYLNLVKTGLSDKTHVEALEKALNENNLDAAFEHAHALKGVYANLSLTPVQKPVSEMTELLRARTQMDYGPLLEETKTALANLCALID